MTAPRRPSTLAQLVDAAKARVKRHLLPDGYVTRRQYRFKNGVAPDLANPRDLSEKVSWLKLHDRSPLHTLCADKIRARAHVAAQIGAAALIPIHLVTYDPDQITPETIRAERFVVKTNHDQGGVFICADRAGFDWAATRDAIRERMARNKYHDFRERQYRDIRPGVLVEALIEGMAGAGPVEVKVNCAHGAPKFLQVILDRFGDRRQAFYSPEWTRMPIEGRAAPVEREVPRPACLDQMLRDAAALAAPFLFCRVDFLQGAGDRRWFNEITFHPAAGLVRYNPPAMERALGDMIDLSRQPEARRRQFALIRRTDADGAGAAVRDPG